MPFRSATGTPIPYVESEKIGFVDVLLGFMKIKNADIYVTGSNSCMLSSDILTSFKDRGDEIRVKPLTYNDDYGILYIGIGQFLLDEAAMDF
jgi:predicted AAA+ superfamily ATPase